MCFRTQNVTIKLGIGEKLKPIIANDYLSNSAISHGKVGSVSLNALTAGEYSQVLLGRLHK